MQSRLIRLLAALLAFSLLAAACGDDDDPVDSADDTADDADDAAEDADDADDDMGDEPAEGEGDDAAADSDTIVDIAAGNEDFSILVTALTQAGLVEALSGPGPFTVFAPTDDAFGAALEALDITADELLAREDLEDILLYHVIGDAAVLSTDLTDGQMATTLNGADITIGVSDAGVTVNDDANVTTADIVASNGVIHVIDAVLLPPAA